MRTTTALALTALLLAPSCRKGQKPDVPPAPWGTAVAGTGFGYAYAATATDPDGDCIRLRFNWDDGTLSDWSALVFSGDTVVMGHAWPRIDTCYVRAQARDERGNVSGWSSFLRVEVTELLSMPPSVPPRPQAPDTGWIGIDYAVTVASTDPEGDMVRYHFDWGDEDWTRTGFVNSGETVTVTHAWPDSGLHVVRACAEDGQGSTSAWSEPAFVRIRPEGTVKWRLDDIGSSYCCPAIADDGTVFVTGDRGLSAVSPDGTIRWQNPDRATSPAAIAPWGVLLYGCYDPAGGCVLRALKLTGTLRWQYRVSGRVRYAPAIGADGTIYFAHDDGVLYALNPDSTLKWSAVISRPRTPPAVGPDGAVFIGSRETLSCFEPDGTVRWQRRLTPRSRANRAFAIAADGTVYFPYLLTAYSPDGDSLWCSGDRAKQPPAIGPDGALYIPNSGKLNCRNADGSLRWEALTSGSATTPALAADGTIYVQDGGSSLSAVRPDGNLMWRAHLVGSPSGGFVTIGRDGTVYVCGDDELFAVIGSAPLANSPWPKYQRDLSNSGRAGP